MRLTLLALPLLLAVPAHPASAIVAGKPVSYTINEDGSACFSASPNGPAAGSASVTGVALPPMATRQPQRGPVAQPFAAAVPLVTTGGAVSVCLGGIGTPIYNGAATYTFDLHGTTGDYVAVVTCQWRSRSICA
jgi:hypothetical protein